MFGGADPAIPNWSRDITFRRNYVTKPLALARRYAVDGEEPVRAEERTARPHRVAIFSRTTGRRPDRLRDSVHAAEPGRDGAVDRSG